MLRWRMGTVSSVLCAVLIGAATPPPTGGYNRRAEDLHRPDYEAGEISRAELHVEPLPPGASDDFRMMFIRSEVPRFSAWRVRILEVEYEK